jgi:NAD(P)-dependent dehydrogenase (short-subunit alcohol dehydrogenase family)
MQGEKVALVTGSSSAIGYETALLLSKRGFCTSASMRNLEKSRVITDIANRENLSLEVAQLDMNDDTSVKVATSKIVAKKGKIDVLVNNTGYDLFSPIEDVTLNQAKEQFETNFFGVVRLAKGVLPLMRKQKKGNTMEDISN